MQPLSIASEWDLLVVGAVLKTAAVVLAIAAVLVFAGHRYGRLEVIDRGGRITFCLAIAAALASLVVGLYARNT